ncbi:TMEM175 family protein [Streptomyces sp. NPDC002886]|uniref:TMEM175 family protein n=1 Tax=Streptomyces sp. NPDC002886 TaxID=3364667 RepID=UPI0036B2129C
MARLVALSDGIYAIAMTLLVIDVAVPAGLGDSAFHQALRNALPNLGAFALSFALTAGFWRDHRRILAGLSNGTAAVTRVILLGLGLVALLPFPTALLAEYASQPEAVAVYATAVAAIHTVHLVLLLLTRHQVHPTASSPGAGERRRFGVRLAVSVVIFVLSIPLAFVSTAAAMWFWLALVPARHLVRRRPSAS